MPSEVIYPLKGKRVFVAGHRGMVGSAIVRRLASEECEILTADRSEMDLKRQDQVERWMAANKPDAVFLAAAKVGGILANDTYPADFLYDNLMIEANLIEAAYRNQVEKLLFLGSSCIYPKMATQPIPEDALLTGPLEPTNEWYAIAKIAGIKLAQAYRRQHGCDFISAMPTNLYGPGDNFDLNTSHVLPALIRKGPRGQDRRRALDHYLGHWNAPAGIPACGRLRRRLRLPDEVIFRRRARQCGLGRGRDNPGAGAAGVRGGRLRGRDRLRHHQARRNATEADERGQAARDGVEAADKSEFGHRIRLQLLLIGMRT